MGIEQSKNMPKNVSADAQDAGLLDMIASRYILTQNFTDMKRLSTKEYCDKLVILTSDIINKFMNEKTIKYLAETKSGPYGGLNNQMKREKIMYLDTGEITDKKQKKETRLHLSEAAEERIKRMREEEEAMALFKQYHQGMEGGNNKSMFSKLDVRNPTQKQRMCYGIARFYVSIAHLYAAIFTTINPVYRYADSYYPYKKHETKYSSKVPENIIPVLDINNSICKRRINLLQPRSKNGEINIKMDNVCNMNARSKKITRTTKGYKYEASEWGKNPQCSNKVLFTVNIKLYNGFSSFGNYFHQLIII